MSLLEPKGKSTRMGTEFVKVSKSQRHFSKHKTSLATIDMMFCSTCCFVVPNSLSELGCFCEQVVRNSFWCLQRQMQHQKQQQSALRVVFKWSHAVLNYFVCSQWLGLFYPSSKCEHPNRFQVILQHLRASGFHESVATKRFQHAFFGGFILETMWPIGVGHLVPTCISGSALEVGG